MTDDVCLHYADGTPAPKEEFTKYDVDQMTYEIRKSCVEGKFVNKQNEDAMLGGYPTLDEALKYARQFVVKHRIDYTVVEVISVTVEGKKFIFGEVVYDADYDWGHGDDDEGIMYIDAGLVDGDYAIGIDENGQFNGIYYRLT